MLRRIFDKHDCDKGSRHSYEKVYEPAFDSLRLLSLTILEIGVFRGASLAAWAEYFPFATIIGVDKFERVHPNKIPALKLPRVKWFQMDSTREAPDVQAHIIIDDGCHDPEAQLATMKLYRPLLYPGGMYFIEDAPTLQIEGAKVFTTGRQFDSRILEL